MTASLNPLTDEDRRQLDRLVDGELPDADRRTLLRRLETAPDGWRSCALAFLESQAWSQGLAGLDSLTAMPPEPATPPGEATPVRRTLGGWGTVTRWALAAGLLIAFGIGMAAGPWATQVLRQRVPGGGQLAGDPRPKGSDDSNSEGPFDEGLSVPVQYYEVRVPDGSGDGAVQQVPVVEGMSMDDYSRMLENWPGPVAPDDLERLRRSGHRIRTRKQMVPVTTADGRRLVLPYYEVEILPPAYQ